MPLSKWKEEEEEEEVEDGLCPVWAAWQTVKKSEKSVYFL